MSEYCEEILSCPYYPRCYEVGYCFVYDGIEPENEGEIE